jgi:hemerythrin
VAIGFTWEQSYSVGNEEIDKQHKRIFELANSLPENPGEKTIGSVVMYLYRHAREHFLAEEKMMKAIDYPKAVQHQELHDAMVMKLNEISTRSFKDDESVFAFKKFFYDWIIDHILHHDMDFFRFVSQQQEG